MLTKVFAPRVWLYLAILLLVVLTACSRPVTQPPPPELPDNLEVGWNRMAPAEETICANGSEYAFFVNPGTVNKLVVDFDGGGACWNGGTCSQPSNPENEFGGVYVEGVYGSPADFGFGGIFDRDNEANPFRDWYHVYVSYCTADLHLGDNVATYTGPGGELTVNHKGAVNTRATLGWVFDNFSAPETVFVTGLSAGAYASIAWLPEIADAYPDADIYQLGDSGAGVVTENFFTGDAANWRLEGALPDLSEPVVLDEGALTNLYTAVGRDYPDAVLSQYNSLFDGTQIGFYGLMQGISPPTQELSLEWSQKMTASLAAIAGETDTFRTYLSTFDADNDPSNGTTHVILNRPEFYTLETNGVRFVDWVNDLVNGRSVESVSPSDAPPSALGDSPTITGTIANLAKGDFAYTRLEIKMGRFASGPIDVYAAGPVSDDGSFSIQLPGEAEMAPRLYDFKPRFYVVEGCDITVTPASHKTSTALDFVVYADGQPAEELLQTSKSDPQSTVVFYTYVDRDVTMDGACTSGDLSGFTYNVDMRKGWNTLVFDFSTLEFRNEDLGAGYGWVIPAFCTIDGDCSVD